MRFIQIVLLAIVAAVCYGLIQDQVTIRVCPEYFTIGHPPLIQTQSLTVLGLFWGVVATWWVGLILGIPLGISARLGSRPGMQAKDLVRPIGILLACMAVLAVCSGAVGYVLARMEVVVLLEPMASRIPRSQHAVFLGIGPTEF